MAQFIYATKYVFKFKENNTCKRLCLESERALHACPGAAHGGVPRRPASRPLLRGIG